MALKNHEDDKVAGSLVQKGAAMNEKVPTLFILAQRAVLEDSLDTLDFTSAFALLF